MAKTDVKMAENPILWGDTYPHVAHERKLIPPGGKCSRSICVHVCGAGIGGKGLAVTETDRRSG